MSAKVMNGIRRGAAIKRVVRHRASREYFKNGQWTANPEEASSFADVIEVAEACARYGLDDVELALRYDAAPHDLFCTPIR